MKNNNKNYKQRIIKALEENNGMITAAYCKENGIPNIYLKNMVEKGRLIRVSRGIYATHNTIWMTIMFFNSDIQDVFILFCLHFIFRE